DGFKEKRLSMYSHTGTHMDAPAHLFEGGKTLDRYHVGHFFGKAFVVDAAGQGSKIGREFLEQFEKQLNQADYALFHTGWSIYWGREEYYGNFPCLENEAASYLASFGLKGVGFDNISADPIDDASLANHRIFLGKEMVIVENLKNLESLAGQGFFWFSAMPLRTVEADGSPVRASAILGNI
ncbi:MAG: hydrolase, partial [Clostridiales bacterium]